MPLVVLDGGVSVLAATRREQEAIARDLERSARFRNRRSRKLAEIDHSTGETDRKVGQAEEEERSRWTRKWIDVLLDIDAPVVRHCRDKAEAHSLLAGLAGRRRGTTLRQRFLQYDTIGKWMVRRHGRYYLLSVSAFITYLRILAEEPCGRSVPRSKLCALSLLEHLGGYDEECRVSLDPLVMETVNALEVQLSRDAPETKKACLLPWIMMASLELYIKSFRPAFLRFVAAMELIKTWGTLRLDDTRGIMTASLRVDQRGVRMKIRRTKTTGAGRKMVWLPVMIDSSCDLTSTGWQQEFRTLIGNPDLVWDRGYAIPFPTDCLTKCLPEPASYEALRAFTLAVQDDLMIPHWSMEADGWVETDRFLLAPGISLLWSAHSPRGMLPSLAADSGMQKEDRDHLAGWSGDGSDTYARKMLERPSRVSNAR
jgi:hypothetical protein